MIFAGTMAGFTSHASHFRWQTCQIHHLLGIFESIFHSMGNMTGKTIQIEILALLYKTLKSSSMQSLLVGGPKV